MHVPASSLVPFLYLLNFQSEHSAWSKVTPDSRPVWEVFVLFFQHSNIAIIYVVITFITLTPVQIQNPGQDSCDHLQSYAWSGTCSLLPYFMSPAGPLIRVCCLFLAPDAKVQETVPLKLWSPNFGTVSCGHLLLTYQKTFLTKPSVWPLL